MICPQCSHENPDDHKFCGECGAKLPPQPVVLNDYFQDRRQVHFAEPTPLIKNATERGNGASPTGNRSSEGSRPKVAETDPSSPGAISSPPDYAAVEKARNKKVTQPENSEVLNPRPGISNYSGGISGPSFLGLSYDPAQESKGFVYEDDPDASAEHSYDSSYLLDEEESHRSFSWKAFALLVVILIFAGLGYLQWKSQLSRAPSRDVSNVLSKNGAAIPEGGIPDFAKEKEKLEQEKLQQQSQQKPAGAEAANAESNNAESKAENAAKPQDQSASANGAQKAETESNAALQDKDKDKGVTVTSTGPRPQEGVTVNSDGKASKTVNDEDSKPESDEADADVADEPAQKQSRSSKLNREDAPQSLGAKDPLLIRAQNFLHGRGVPQNCQTGLNLLRQSAQTNPKAQIQMGALYMSGHCVTQDRVSAYKWFSQALALEPNNQFVERNRASLWANMTADERKRIREANFY